MQEFVTRQGEALYIPLGWRHFATPTDGHCSDPENIRGLQSEATESETAALPRRSVHVTMGVQLPRWGDLIDGTFVVYASFRVSTADVVQFIR